ncbi:hypothetical protein [Azospirillum sp. sgz301742]
MKRAVIGAALLLGGCNAHNGASLNEKLYNFANAGMVRVGDGQYASLQATQVHSPRECAALTQPGARVSASSYDTLRSLCVKDASFKAEVAAVN